MEFTLDELTAEVAARLDRAGFAQGNGQVSPVPDRRTLRYYTTIGLLDRPLAIRDRQAIYGDRHVLQALAVKRLQAAGHSLAEIQAQLAGLPNEQLAGLSTPGTLVGGRRSARFWAAARPEALPPTPPPVARPAAMTFSGQPAPPVPPTEPVHPASAIPPGRAVQPAVHPASAAPSVSGPAVPKIRTLVAVPLDGDLSLLIPAERPLTPEDAAAVRQAAEPLLRYLSSAGLTGSQSKERS